MGQIQVNMPKHALMKHNVKTYLIVYYILLEYFVQSYGYREFAMKIKIKSLSFVSILKFFVHVQCYVNS